MTLGIECRNDVRRVTFIKGYTHAWVSTIFKNITEKFHGNEFNLQRHWKNITFSIY